MSTFLLKCRAEDAQVPDDESQCPDTMDQPLQKGDVVSLAGSGPGSLQQPLSDQVPDQYQGDHERQADPCGYLGYRAGLLTFGEYGCPLELDLR
jgi:hypothetical protein